MRLGFHLWRSQQAVQRAADAALRPLGGSGRSIGALEQIALHPGLSAAELARKLVITPQSTQGVVDELERRGWVARDVHPKHRSAAALHVTAAGQAVLDVGVSIANTVEERLCAALSDDERATLIALLDRVHASAH